MHFIIVYLIILNLLNIDFSPNNPYILFHEYFTCLTHIVEHSESFSSQKNLNAFCLRDLGRYLETARFLVEHLIMISSSTNFRRISLLFWVFKEKIT